MLLRDSGFVIGWLDDIYDYERVLRDIILIDSRRYGYFDRGIDYMYDCIY